MKYFKVIILAMLFLKSIVAAVNDFGLTSEQQVVYLDAVQQYMRRLNETCRGPEIAENFLRLPEQFFELETAPNSTYVGVVYIKANTSFSAALDSLTQVSSDKPIIDCALAAAFSNLQGIRAVLGDDVLFDRVCNKFSNSIDGDKSHERNSRTELTNHVNYPSFMNFFNQPGKAIPGALCGIAQLNTYNDFLFDGLGHFTNLEELVTSSKKPNIYSVKHPASDFPSQNVIMLANNQCIHFMPGTEQPMTLEKAIRLLMGKMDENVSAHEATIGYPKTGPNSEEATSLKLKFLNSIRYKNKDVALKKIKSNAKYSMPMFSFVFESVAAIHTVEALKISIIAMIGAYKEKHGQASALALLRTIRGLSTEEKYKALTSAIEPASVNASAYACDS